MEKTLGLFRNLARRPSAFVKTTADKTGDGSTLRQSSGQAFEPTVPLVLRSESDERLEASPRAGLVDLLCLGKRSIKS